MLLFFVYIFFLSTLTKSVGDGLSIRKRKVIGFSTVVFFADINADIRWRKPFCQTTGKVMCRITARGNSALRIDQAWETSHRAACNIAWQLRTTRQQGLSWLVTKKTYKQVTTS